MSSKDHYAEIRSVRGAFRAEYEGVVLAESGVAQELQEYHPDYEFPPVPYFPPGSVHMELLERNAGHNTSCPIKGTASYWHLRMGTQSLDNVCWSYEAPLPEAAAIERHIAFDRSKGVIVKRDGVELGDWRVKKR